MDRTDSANTIQTLDIELSVPSGIQINQAAGSLFHGVLMENIDSDYADFLHSQSVRPYSQYLRFNAKSHTLHWRITALNAQASHELLQPLIELPGHIYLRHKHLQLDIKAQHLSDKLTYKQMAQKYFYDSTSVKGIVKYTFLTSAGFKSSGEYLIFPAPPLIFNSLLRRFNAFSQTDFLDRKGIAGTLEREVEIADYNLHYSPFSVEGRKIPAFKGSYSLKISKNLMARRIITMLSEYATYCGIGIKTSLGMGAVKVE